jgi:hydroxyacylglutathione hydrolase
MESIHAIPALRDNYIWAIEYAPGRCAVVDPGCAESVRNYLQAHSLQLSAILITHHHWDHTDGIEALCAQQSVPVYGPKRENIPCCSDPLQDGDVITIADSTLSFTVIDTPGHTKGHISYHGHGCLFCGDTLFLAGCGRLFEGTAEQLHQSLLRIAALPDDTLIYCGHEYTLNNLAFAQSIEPDNTFITRRIEACEQQRQQQQPTVPATLAQEKQSNPFLRCHLPTVQQAMTKHSGHPISNAQAAFTALRQCKDAY